MRNIATCYSEHAVRVSDSYCSSSGPLINNPRSSSSYTSTTSSSSSPKSIPSFRNAVSYTYKSKLLSSSKKKPILITITWTTNKLTCPGFFIKLTETGPHHMVSRPMGQKRVDQEYEVHWDLSSARYDSGPEPISSFYVLILKNSQTALYLGDKEVGDEVVVAPPCRVAQCENFTGGGRVTTAARFSGGGERHDVAVEWWGQEMCVHVDGKRVVRVKRLQWNFRGNQVIFIDGLLVDVMWDVYEWYSCNYGRLGKGSDGIGKRKGLVLFRTRSGLDSRLWLEEEEKKLKDKKGGGGTRDDDNKPDFSLLLCVYLVE